MGNLTPAIARYRPCTAQGSRSPRSTRGRHPPAGRKEARTRFSCQALEGVSTRLSAGAWTPNGTHPPCLPRVEAIDDLGRGQRSSRVAQHGGDGLGPRRLREATAHPIVASAKGLDLDLEGSDPSGDQRQLGPGFDKLRLGCFDRSAIFTPSTHDKQRTSAPPVLDAGRNVHRRGPCQPTGTLSTAAYTRSLARRFTRKSRPRSSVG
jgi:hypothetical protein